jgi:thioredoxin reductase (NADPH)
VEIITGTVVSAIADGDQFHAITLKKTNSGEERELAVAGMFVAIGLVPENDAFLDLAKLDERGYFDSDEDCLTKTEGVFVAGDCRRKGVRQVTTATADGATAAIAACRYLDSL